MHCNSRSAEKRAATPRNWSAHQVLLAAMALAAIPLALSIPAPLPDQRPGAALAAATLASAHWTDEALTSTLRHEGVPLFFGFLEFDWEPGRIPGYGPWPAAQEPA